MSMKDGIKKWVDSALDAKDEVAEELLDLGLQPKEALKVSTYLVKKSVNETLERHLQNKNAAEITNALSNDATRNPLVS
jgi:hypothetical protein